MLQQHLLKAPCVRLKPYLRRLEISLNHLERLEGVLEQANTMILLNKSSKSLSFNLYASTTPFESAVFAFETVFAPSWIVVESSWAVFAPSWCLWAVLSRLEGSWTRLGASKNIDFSTYIYQKSVFQLYASTTPFGGALCAFETVFALSWNVFEPSWASWKRLGASKHSDFVKYTY